MNKRELFFIRGYARSGTNWLCNLANLHPEVNCRGEFHLENLFEGFEATLDMPYGLLSRKSPEFKKDFYEFIENLLFNWCGKAPVFGDRTPIGILDAYFPKKKYLLITRDGRDVMVSLMYHNLRLGLSNHSVIQTKREKYLLNSNYFEENKKELLDSKEFLQGWAKTWNKQIISDIKAYEQAKADELDIDCYWVKYEELCKETEILRNEIYEFLGLNPFKAESLTDITKPGFESNDTKSHYRKGKSGAWKDYFTEEQIDWFIEVAKEGMKLLNL